MSGLAPVGEAVKQIQMACQMIVRSGAVPGAEVVCGQIIALATGLIPMAASSAMGMGGGAGVGAAGGPGGMAPMPAPPGGPAPMMGGGM